MYSDGTGAWCETCDMMHYVAICEGIHPNIMPAVGQHGGAGTGCSPYGARVHGQCFAFLQYREQVNYGLLHCCSICSGSAKTHKFMWRNFIQNHISWPEICLFCLLAVSNVFYLYTPYTRIFSKISGYCEFHFVHIIAGSVNNIQSHLIATSKRSLSMPSKCECSSLPVISVSDETRITGQM